MFRYTGHPFVNVGIATMVAFNNKSNPEAGDPSQLTESQIDRFIEEIFRVYKSRTMINYVSGVLFPNYYPFNQIVVKHPKFDEVRHDMLRKTLYLYKPNASIPEPPNKDGRLEPADEGENCAFCGSKAVIRASRTLIPMTLAEEFGNFTPEGRPKLPICGSCLLALFAMPFGGLNSGGKMWIVHSNDAAMLQYLAANNLQRNLEGFFNKSLEAGSSDSSTKTPNYSFARTHLMTDLVNSQRSVPRGLSLTAYLFTSAAKDAKIQIYHLPSQIIDFAITAKRGYPDYWNELVKRAEYTGPKENTKQTTKEDKATGEKVKISQTTIQTRNFFLEDLFDLPRNAHSFLKRYFLRTRKQGTRKGEDKYDPRFDYSILNDREMISWKLTDLFLEKVMNMDKERIEAIRNLGDEFADYIHQHNGKTLFFTLFTERRDYVVRLALLRAANDAQKQTKQPLLPYDAFIKVFFAYDGETAHLDWYLARDLLLIRIIEQLHKKRWMDNNPDVLSEIDRVSSKIEENEENEK